MARSSGRRKAATESGGGGSSSNSSSARKDAAEAAPRKMRLRRRPALADISAAVGNNQGSGAAAGAGAGSKPGARKTRKRKASDSGVAAAAAAQDPPPRPTSGHRRQQASSASSSSAAGTAVVSEGEDEEEEEEEHDGRRQRQTRAPRRASRDASAPSHAGRSSSSRKGSGGSEGLAAAAAAAAAATASLIAEAAAREARLKRCKVPPSEVSEHDVVDRDDPIACAEYAMDMYKRYKELEEKYTPTVYMHTQVDINCKMRAILIDWIVEVHLKFKLADPTLYLTCHIIDRFCMQENVHRSKLQLVGVTALLIACKYEEIFPTEVRDCVYITDHAYTREEVLEMEQTILRRLKFELTVPTQWTFLVRFLKIAKATDRQHHRAQYYLERCLQEHEALSFRPSMLAAASVFLARIPDSGIKNAWPDALAKFCNTPREGLECCARLMIKFLLDEPVTASQRHLVAVKKKFLGERFLAVAIDDLPTLPRKPNIASN
ncbi:Cyclin B1 [Ectocarpus siliculosus]|uniref:Cyclin B1 n=1 Tax=Ectocarpus siliculosus TaxID=2880 RepID=D7G632_ECTSI|nr:Cyclin B1 [Ectocarpus siliculosus]|eukprot:CBJ27441.1 Cyclin B1 [Ectocarpus siliculosus]